MGEFIGCRLLQLPKDQIIPAARTAILENPANKPVLMPMAQEDVEEAARMPVLTPMHLALLTSKYWGTGGVKLTVSFMDRPTASLRRKIMEHGNAWGKYANVVFTETSGVGQVRIARVPGQGYYSYLGTDILHIPAGQQTTNFDSFTDSTPESELYRVVRHEFGHLLGLIHEHQRREIVDQIDPALAFPFYQATQGWSEQEVWQQVLTAQEDSLLQANAPDVRSIMCYELPASIMRNRVAVPGGTDIDDSDKALVAKLYPLAGDPIRPPVGTSALTVVLARDFKAGTYTLAI